MKTTSYKITPACPAFAGEIAEIEISAFAHPWSRASILSEMERTDSVFLVCLSGEEVCGYVNCRNVCGEGYIGNLAVKKDHQRHGVGRMLLQALNDAARKQDMLFLTLEVRASNIPAIRLYETGGYKKVGERPDFYTDPTENAILYTLDLK